MYGMRNQGEDDDGRKTIKILSESRARRRKTYKCMLS